MELVKAKALAIELMTQYQLFEKGWKFEFNNRMNSFGVCNYTKKTIYLSAIITPITKEEKVRDTILHEVAHALVGKGHNHDYVWQRQAIAIGCSGKRCSDLNEEAESQELLKAMNNSAPYKLVCDTCGWEVAKKRRPKVEISCATCCPRFNRNYLLRVVNNRADNATVAKPIVPMTKTYVSGITFAVSIMNDKLIIESDLQMDSYGKSLLKFVEEIGTSINNAGLYSIILPLLSMKSWRLLNREFKKGCNQYCTDHNIMNHREFQSKYFYEGVMINRQKWGANAPWIK